VKVKCQVVEDLLPLYIDEVCSSESKVIVEEHLKECNICRDKLNGQKNEVIIDKNLINENLKSKEPFKKIKNSQRVRLELLGLLIISLVLMVIWGNSTLIWHSGANKFMEKFIGQPSNIIENSQYSYKGKKYRIILSAPKGSKDNLYLQCFQEKFGGLFYEPTYAASPGDCKSLYGMTMHFTNGSNDHFIIAYGYNKDFIANSYSVRNANNNNWVTEDISKKEYFLKIYTDIVYPEIIFKGKNGNDISTVFYGQ